MQRRPLAALGAALSLLAAVPGGADPRQTGALSWPDEGEHFGWSGLEVSDNGRRFTALSDQGILLDGQFLRAADGRIVGLETGKPTRLADVSGQPLEGKEARDSEGLAIDPAGRLCVSFEGQPRVWCYAAPGAAAEPLRVPRDFNGLEQNEGLEALAIGPTGLLYAIAEAPPGIARRTPGYVYDGARWRVAFTLWLADMFQPVGADFGPDGHLYLLERQFAPPIGFASRVRRITFTSGGGAEIETVLTTTVGVHGNLEGLSVWQDADGALHLTMVSDNNGQAFARSQVVEYRLDP